MEVKIKKNSGLCIPFRRNIPFCGNSVRILIILSEWLVVFNQILKL